MTQTAVTQVGPSCEPVGGAGWVQAASAWTSLAFVVAGIAIIVVSWRAHRRRRGAADGVAAPSAGDLLARNATALRVILGLLAIGNGIGSVIQHGPEPSWNAVVHDPPLLGALALLAADAVADLGGCRLRHWWWVAPTAACAVLAAWAPVASTVFQVVVAVVCVALSLVRWWVRPELRARLLVALGLLAVGGGIGTMSRPGWPWCVPDGWWFEAGMSGHAVWHVLAAAALFALAPVLGHRGSAPAR